MSEPLAGRLALGGGWTLWPVAAVRTAGMPFSWLAGFTAGDREDDLGMRARSARTCRHLVRQDLFAEAVQWQNPGLAENWLGAYRQAIRAAGDGEDVPLSRRGQRERLLATLAQRYCAKNETIGFFGPVAWARFDGDRPGTTATGTRALRSRAVCLEWHVAAAVAAAAAADPELMASLPVRRHPLVSVSGGKIMGPRGPYEPRTGTAGKIVAALSRPATERQLRDLVADEDFAASLASLTADGVILRDLPVPVGDHPELMLAQLLETLPDTPGRQAWRVRLAEVSAGLAAVGAAAGDVDALAAATAQLDQVLARITGAAGGVRSGRYGRSTVYEDCRLDLDITIGTELLGALRDPLTLLLRSARWLVAEVGREVVTGLRAAYRQLAAGGRPVPLVTLMTAGADVLSGAPGTAVHRVLADFTARWAEVLELARDGVLSSAAARPLAEAMFPDPGPAPWQAARQHSPDVMLRARPGGPPQWVLGELHLALNTLENRVFRSQADDPGELLAAARADYPLGRIVPVWPAASPEVTSRTYPPLGLDLPGHYDYWSYAADEGHPAGVPSWPGSSLRVVDGPGQELTVEPPDAAWRRPVAEFFGEFLTALVVNRFQLYPPQPHTRRLLIDDVVVVRETWRVPVASLAEGARETGYRRRRLADALAALGCPPCLFVTLAGHKPVFVDQRAPLLLHGLAHLLRSEAARDPSAEVKLTEMLPEPGALWLHNADGEPVTSELRIVVAEPPRPGAPVITLPGRPGDAP